MRLIFLVLLYRSSLEASLLLTHSSLARVSCSTDELSRMVDAAGALTRLSFALFEQHPFEPSGLDLTDSLRRVEDW